MDFFETGVDELGLELVYDVAHNIGKFEKHLVDGIERELFVHAKVRHARFQRDTLRSPTSIRRSGSRF